MNCCQINDSRRALNFSYNVLNLLSEVKTTSGLLKAKYDYFADGTKLRVRDASGNGFDYLGSLTYKTSSAGLQLESVNFGSGVIRADVSNSGQQEVNYFLTDHLGSVRVIVDGSGVVKERNDYYPFGARQARGDYLQRNGNRYKYNGKEEQVTGGLDYLDYGWRMLDKSLGRWFSMDKLSEMMPSVSGYVYGLNNPVNYRDLYGLFPKKKDPPIGNFLLDEVLVTAQGNYTTGSSSSSNWYYPGLEPTWDGVPDWDELARRGREVRESQRAERDRFLASLKTDTDIAMDYVVNPVGIYFSTSAGLRYTPDLMFRGTRLKNGYWRTSGGKYYSLRILEKGANGKYVPGINGLRISFNVAKGSAVVANSIGRRLGWVSVIYSGFCFGVDPNWRDGIDIVMGVASIVYWPIGVAYFGTKLFLEGMLNYTQTMTENGLVPGRDDMIIWK